MAQLPPMTTLLAFEAVARRRSFALAAAELSLTASAISHQIARLETFVGARLLERTTAGVRLSAAGEVYLQRVGGALGALNAATNDLRQGVRNSLYVHASPSLASLWLMPRLADFAHTYPEISLHLSASHIHSDFATGQVDLDIRYGKPDWPNLVVTPLFKERVLPLANPALLKRLLLKTPADLLTAPLIQSTVSVVQWVDWFAARGLTQTPDRFALRFDRAQLVLDAAVQGLGVALESSTVASSHLGAGRLIPIYPIRQSMIIEGHFMVYPASHSRRKEVEAFTQWLKKQACSMPNPLTAWAKQRHGRKTAVIQ
jgi:DNA-binding transcriptional LysR family regulator